MKNFLRILYILFFIIAGLWVIFHPAKTETNLLRAVYSNNFSDELIVELQKTEFWDKEPNEAKVILERFNEKYLK